MMQSRLHTERVANWVDVDSMDGRASILFARDEPRAQDTGKRWTSSNAWTVPVPDTPNRDVLLRPLASAVVETEQTVYEGVGSDDLWHLCSTHPNAGDPSCGPGCMYYCGLPVAWDDMDVVEDDDDSDCCVVCLDLDGAHA